MSLRLATFNLFSGRSLTGGAVDPDRIVDAVAALDADVLAVQEVDRGLPRSGGHDQAALVARAVAAAGYRFVPLVTGTPGAPRRARAPRAHSGPRDGSYGIALVSRRPVEAWHVLHFAPPPGRWPIVVPGGRPRIVWLADEPRAVIAAELADPPLVVAGTHLSFVPGINAVQLRRARGWLTRLARAAGSPPTPRDVVLMGDLNLPGGLPARLTGWRSLVTGPTFPTFASRVQLDHILVVDPTKALAARGRIVQLPIGDHCAVVADVEY